MSTQAKLQALKSADLEPLREQQLEATTSSDGRGDVDHVSGNVDDAYELPAHEQHLMHVEVVTSTPNPVTRRFDHQRQVVKLSAIEFERMEKNDSFAPYDEVNIKHDARPKARQKADQTGDTHTGSPAEANKPLESLQDAQMRYRELTKQDAPADKSFEELVALIGPLEAKLKAEKSTKPLRNKADYQARYKELTGEEAPTEKTVEDLKEAIAHFETTK